MILLDTNVLVYAVGRPHQLAEVAADVVAMSDAGGMRITPRVLEEFAYVYARRDRGRDLARELCWEWSAILGPIEHATEEDLAMALDLWADNARLQFADALLAAQAVRLDATLVSADKAFAEVEKLRFVDLADPELQERLQPN